MAKHTEAAPALPPASIDFNALHEACRKGKSAENALKAALARPEAAAAAQAPAQADDTPPAE